MLKQYLVRSKIPKFFFYKDSVLKRIKNCFQFSKLNINIYSTRLTGSFAHPFLEIILALTVPLKVGHFKSFSNDGRFLFSNFYGPFLGSCEVPQKIWARSVQTFKRSSVTNKQTTNRQPDKQIIYIYIYIQMFCFKIKNRYETQFRKSCIIMIV